MPLTLTKIAHDTLCHGSRWTIADENDLARKVAYLALGQSRHISTILAGIDKKPPSTRPDTAKGAINLLTVPTGKDSYHRDGWVFQAISWIAAHRANKGNIVRAPHAILAHKGFDGMQLQLDAANENVIAVVIFEDKATINPRSTITSDVWKGIRSLERGERMPELIQETGALLEAHQMKFPDMDIDAAVEKIIWEEARHYRVAVTIDTTHDDDNSRKALFKGFDEIAPGKGERRQGETMCIQNLRSWMEQFAAKAIGHIEAWRDNV
ncbi:hypothetical protein ABF231_001009 [Yersinia ruckeri]|uniref:hypothetical protein n=1 Tax=Yersinia ruckeri TaxID=29486 RepID=UPI0022377681|nr:hypothetical protein [Yersinia ruckeri]EKN4697763.1 hypothetical protein [Yersinia ruckeri]MCW6584779.1 hypothetical protein [Yersinia ruckeri]